MSCEEESANKDTASNNTQSEGILTFESAPGLTVEVSKGSIPDGVTISASIYDWGLSTSFKSKPVSKAYVLEPHGVEFLHPLIVNIPINESPDDKTVVIVCEPQTSECGLANIIGYNNTHISVYVSHFSIFEAVKSLVSNPSDYETIDSGFNFDLDRFAILNISEDFQDLGGANGACFGFVGFASWYFKNQKSYDGSLSQAITDSCAKQLIIEAHGTINSGLLGSILFGLDYAGGLVTSDSWQATNLILGLKESNIPQVLLLQGDFGNVHSILVYKWDPPYFYAYDPNLDEPVKLEFSDGQFPATYKYSVNDYDKFTALTLTSLWLPNKFKDLWGKYKDCEEVCMSDCNGKECGSDGCGGSCGSCLQGEICSNGSCKSNPECVPQCVTGECGDDGCGGSCGECPDGYGCDVHRLCFKTYCGDGYCNKVEENCNNCSDDCGKCFGNCGNGKCEDNEDENCKNCLSDCTCDSNQICLENGTCSSACVDNDQDGYGTNCSLGKDCNDNSSLIHPNQNEICNGKDDNCDQKVDEGCDCTSNEIQDCGPETEKGKCQFGTQECDNGSWGECMDAIYPVDEICDKEDNNCDGKTDEGVKNTYYDDNDGDGYGDPNDTKEACNKPFGYVTDSEDCNDNNKKIKPGAEEICDTWDNNCDGQKDESGVCACEDLEIYTESYSYTGSYFVVNGQCCTESDGGSLVCIVDSFSSPAGKPTGLAWDGEYLWNTTKCQGKIYKLTTEGEVVNSFNAPDWSAIGADGCGSGPQGLAWDGENLWYANDSKLKIYKLTSDGKVLNSFYYYSFAHEPRGLAWDGEYLWSAADIKDKIYKFTTDGEVLNSFDTPANEPGGLAWQPGFLWYGDRGTGMIYKLTTSGQIIDFCDSPDGKPTGLVWGDDYLWIAGGSIGKIYKVEITD